MRSSARCALLMCALAAAQARADDGEWFPPPCSAPALGGAGPQLVQVRTGPEDSGRDIVLRREADGALWAEFDDVAAWVHRDPAMNARNVDGRRWLELSRVPGLVTRFDACRQELLVDWVASARPATQRGLLGQAGTPPTRPQNAGLYLNLDADVDGGTERETRLGGLATLGVFHRLGSGRSGWLDRGRDVVRLESSWVYDWPEQALRLVAGDSITRAAPWGTPVRYGGVRFGTEFSLQPEFITYPLPGLSGLARLPSTLDVLVNGVPRERTTVPAGPYTLTDVPVFTGAGELQIEVLDALGRRQRLTQPFYAAPQLLKPGLAEHSLEAGWLRENFALASDDYGDPFAAWSWRRGVSDAFTWQERVETARGQFTAGNTLLWLWPWAGLWSADLAASHAQGRGGLLYGLGFERIARAFSVSLRHRATTGEFAQLGEAPGALVRSDLARVSVALGRVGTVTVLALDERRATTAPVRLVGGTLAHSLGRWGEAYLNVTAPEQARPQWLLGWSCPLGGRTAVSTQVQQSGDRRVVRGSFQQGAPGPLGPEFRVSADGGDSHLAQAAGRWTMERGAVLGEVTHESDRESWHAGGSTAGVLMDGGAYWTRPVQNAFAVVDTGDVPGVRVYRENLLVGTTDARGRLLVPDLRPYETNHLSVNELDWPMQRYPERTTAAVAPVGGSGVTLDFASAPAAVALTLVLEDGTPVPAGAAVEVDGAPQELPVAYDGAAYVQLPATARALDASWPGGACRAVLQAPPAPNTTLRCEARP